MHAKLLNAINIDLIVKNILILLGFCKNYYNKTEL